MARPAYLRNEAKFVDHGSYDPLMVCVCVYHNIIIVLLMQSKQTICVIGSLLFSEANVGVNLH